MKQKLLSSFLLVGIMLLAIPGFSNVTSYTFTQSNATYSEISGGTVQGDSTNDDNSYSAINLGFTFYFNGVPYTQVSVNSNGFLAFGNTISSSYNALSAGTSNNVVAALNHDIEGQFGAEMQTKRTGVAGNYVFVVQWKDFRSYDFPPTDGDYYNFQIRLNEADGKIEVVYGSFLKEATPRTAEVGLRGASSADFNNRTSLTSWSASTAGALVTDAMALEAAITPANGLSFSWMPPANDLALLSLVSPLVPGCYGANETVSVRIKNTSSTSINFVTNPVTVNGNVAITNPTTFPAVLINTGSLAGGATMDVVLSNSFNMTAAGNYQFNASITPTGDPFPSNNTLPAITASSTQTIGVASISSDTICSGSSIDLILTGSNGAVQWQSYIGSNWVNETGIGNNSATYSISPSANGQYRATVCGSLISNSISLAVLTSADPIVPAVSRCGEGDVTMTATGPGTHFWYDVATGGAPLDSGNTYTTYLTSTATFYASSIEGGSMVHVGPLYSGSLTNGLNLGNHGIMITTLQPNINITAADIAFNGSGTFTIALKDPSNATVINSAVTGTATGLGSTSVTVPFNLNIANPGSYLLMISAVSGSVSNLGYIDSSVYPYTSTLLDITAGYWYGSTSIETMYLFNLQVSKGCESNRVPVVATINAAPSATLNASSQDICTGNSIVLSASSANPNYTYTWSPATGLSAVTGATVNANPSNSITYTLNANDALSGCHFLDTVSINVQTAGIASISSDTICLGIGATLSLSGSNGAIQWQYFDGSTWIDETGSGSNSTTYVVNPLVSTDYRASSCSSNYSDVINLTVLSSVDPVVPPVSRCGEGDVTFAASGPGIHYWYDVATGGTPLDSGSTYTAYLTSSATYYASSLAGGSAINAGPLYSGSLTNGASTGNHGIMITTAQPNVNINGADMAFTGTGTITISLMDPNTMAVINSFVTGTVTGSGSTPSLVPFTLTVSNPGDYLLLVTNVSGTIGNLGYIDTSVFPYTSSAISITAGYWYGATTLETMYLFNLRVSTGCESARVPVLATINNAPTATASASNSNFCSGTTVNLTAASSNSNYAFTWSPAAGLSGTSGATVSATPASTTTYTMDANDAGTGCHFVALTSLTVNPTPQTTVTATPASLCLGSQSQLLASSSVSIPMDFLTVGTGTLTNLGYEYPAPYASHYWGNRQQFIIPGSELAAAGLTAGPINSLGFDVENTNGSMNLANFEVKIGNTNLNALTTFQTGLTQVYTNASYAPANGWNMHDLSTPFIWNGVSNIIVETCFNNSSYIGSSNASVRQTSTAYSSSINYNADASNVCGNTIVNNVQNQRPNIRFGRRHNYQYAWTPTSSINVSTIANPVAQPMSSTTYWVTVTDSNNTCSHLDSVAVAVGTIVPNTAGGITGTTTLCQGSSATYSVGAVLNASSYSWVVPSGATITTGSSTNTIVVNYSSTAIPGNIVVTPLNGCGNGGASQPLAITVNPLPAAAGAIVGLNNDTVCKGETGVAYSVPAIPGATSYFWTIPSGATIATGGSTNSITINYSAGAVSGNIIVKGFNSCGFGPTSTFPVAVYGTPAQTAAVHGPASVCQGQDMVMFYVDPVVGATDYVWNVNLFGATIVGDATNDTVYVNIANNSTPGVIFVNGHSPCATGLASPSLSVLVNNAPAAAITSSNTAFTICLNDSAQLGVTPACAGCTYAWTPGTDLSDSTIANPYASPIGNTTYTVTVTSNGCNGTASQAFTVLPAATQATISLSNDTLYSSVSTSYQWNLNGAPIAGANNVSYRFTANGVYTVTTTDANGCHSTSAPQTINSTSIAEHGSYASMNVYPNPFTQNTTLSYVLSGQGRVSIEILNLLGQRVQLVADETQASGVHNYTIDLQDQLSSGVFILKLTTDKRSYFERLTLVK